MKSPEKYETHKFSDLVIATINIIIIPIIAKAIWKELGAIKEKNKTNRSKSAFKITKNRPCLIYVFFRQKLPRRNLRSERHRGAFAEICLVLQILAHAVLRRLFIGHITFFWFFVLFCFFFFEDITGSSPYFFFGALNPFLGLRVLRL